MKLSSPEKQQEAENELQQKKEHIEQKANVPLDTHWKILCLLFPGPMNFFLAFIFKNQGYERKFKEAFRWTLYGFGFYLIPLVLMIVLYAVLHGQR
ncbi:MAG: hypothetical protein K9G46_03875 [Flavobacteriales bacterium]|jgi:predicted nucleic acid-binding protein|nr:hypothetical protein [Flavobacteriales bacterium]